MPVGSRLVSLLHDTGMTRIFRSDQRAMTMASVAASSGARRRQFMEGRSAERLADEIRQRELAHIRARKCWADAQRGAPKPAQNQ